MSCAAGVLSAAPGSAGDAGPAWLAGLTRQLHSMSAWVRTANAAGVTELHCGVSDVPAWAGCAAKLAGQGNRVMAHGNVLSFSLNNRAVRVVMHPAA